MSGMNWRRVRSTMSYWFGALSEPVLMVSPAEMQVAVADGAIVWDVREEAPRLPTVAALHLGSMEWLLADNLGGNLIPAAVIAARLSKVGIEPGQPVILYAEGSAIDALIALRALRSIGVDAQVCLGDAEPVNLTAAMPA